MRPTISEWRHVMSWYHMPERRALIRQTRRFDLREYNMLHFCRSNLADRNSEITCPKGTYDAVYTVGLTYGSDL